MKQKLFTILTLLLCLCSGAWADDVTLYETDFTTWSNATLVTNGDFTCTTSTYPKELYVRASGSGKTVSITDDGLTFNGNLSVNNHIAGIKLTGINKSVTITVTHPYSSKKPTYRYYFVSGATAYSSSVSGVSYSTSTAPSANGGNCVITISNINNTQGVLYIGPASSSYYTISSINITTPEASGKTDPALTVSPASQSLYVDGAQQITASATSTGAITYSSDNTNVATVSDAGLITAVGIGNATITTSIAETDTYDSDSKQTTIIVKPADLTITKYATFDGSAVSSPEDYFTVTNPGDYNTKFAGTYGGTDYARGLKFNSNTSVDFTTSVDCDLVVVQSLQSNPLIRIDGTTFSTNYDTQSYYDDATNKVRVYTVKGLAAGSHSITRNSEFGMLYIGVTEPLAPSLSVSPTSASAFAYVVDNGPSDAQTFTVTGSNLTATITATLSNTTNYEMKTVDGEYGAGPLTDLASGTAVQVRLKAGLAKGDSYNGNLTFSSTGADNKVVALTGSVTGQTYAVTYDLNGASGDAPTQAATEEGGKFNLAAAPTRTCYTFNGWKCNVDNVTYAANDEYTMTAAPTTFTAQWTANYSTSLDFAAVTLAKINDGTEPPAIATFLAGGNMVGENVDQGTSGWETGGDWHGIIKEGYLGYKVKYSGAKVSFLAPAGKLVTIVLGSIGANVTLSKNGTTSTISSKSGDNAETIVTPFVTEEDMLVSLTTTNTSTVTLKNIIISDYATASISAAEYATFYNADKALDFSTTGITVYTAQDKETSVGLTEIESGKVPANTPVVLYKAGADGTAINVPVIASAAAIEGTNDLRVSTGTDVDYMYVLAMNPTIGFYPWTGTNLPAGKIYLQGKASYGAREFLGFDANTSTAINNVVVKTIDENAPMYNLAGQRVNKSYKGVVIVNGKKYMNK